MATKKTTRAKGKTAAVVALPPPAPPPEPQEFLYTCRKCGNHESVTQLRKVVVDIGWKLSQINSIAPCMMCTKCGHCTVSVNASIGDLAGLVPDMTALPRGPKPEEARGKERKRPPVKHR